jgi:hypothetical protein
MKLSAFQAFCTVKLTLYTQLQSLRKIIPKYLQLLPSEILWSPTK